MRARQLKPEFFTDRKIAAMGPIAALVYQALWVSADDGGVALSDPDRLKGELFWAWPSISTDDIAGALRQLEEMGRVETYMIGDDRYARIVMFSRHQKPHNPSSFRYPRPDAPTSPADAGASADDDECGSTEEGGRQEGGSPRIPNPLSRIPAPSSLNPESGGAARTDAEDVRDAITVEFDTVWAAYPKRAGGNGKADALAQYRTRRKEGVAHAVILAGVERYARYCTATDKTGTEYVKQARTFLGRGRHYEELWEVPARTTTGTGGRRDRFAPPSDVTKATIAAMVAAEESAP